MPIVNIIYPKVCAVRLIDRKLETIRFSIKASLFLAGLCVLFISSALILIDYVVLYVFKNSVETQYLYLWQLMFSVFTYHKFLFFCLLFHRGEGMC